MKCTASVQQFKVVDQDELAQKDKQEHLWEQCERELMDVSHAISHLSPEASSESVHEGLVLAGQIRRLLGAVERYLQSREQINAAVEQRARALKQDSRLLESLLDNSDPGYAVSAAEGLLWKVKYILTRVRPPRGAITSIEAAARAVA